MQFLFAAALFALPLAALPLILHLLYRRKSPVVPFPTLRYIKASLQQSAARRKVQRWLLLAVRMLLLALLIWAVAQPAKILASRFFGSEVNSVAVVVVDTSWSMQYRRNELPLLAEAEQIVQQLFRNELKDSSVLLLTSASGKQTTFRSPADLLANWTALKPQVSAVPLADRVTDASNLLAAHPAAEKLLVVISDFQSREFPRPMPQLSQQPYRLVVLDLHPQQPRSSGIQKITLSPAQPIAGLRVTAEVEVTGPPGETRPVSAAVSTPDGKELLTRPPVMASLDNYGHASVRFEFQLPSDRWQVLGARVHGEDPMAWDDLRSLAIELPPQQRVTVIDGGEASAPARRLVALALDPNEGKLGSWPLRVEISRDSRPQSNAIVAVLDQWPAASVVQGWQGFVSSGGTLVLMFKPGLESSFAASPAAGALEQLLPSRPYAFESSAILRFAGTAAGAQEAVTSSLLADSKALDELRAARIVPMSVADQRSTRMLIGGIAGDRRMPADREGLLFVRRVGAGRVYTWSCTPDAVNTNLGTHPMFLPLLVNQCLRPLETSAAANVELGQPATCDPGQRQGEMEIHTPSGEAFRVAPKGNRYEYEATTPGLYQWFRPGEDALRGITNVRIPGAEAEAAYRSADTIIAAAPNVLIAGSLQDMQQRVAQVSQPQPRWTWPLVLRTRLSPAHAEGGQRRYQVAVQRFLGDEQGHVRGMEIAEVKVERDAEGRRRIVPVGQTLEIPCDMALLAIGFDGVEHMPLLDGLGLRRNNRGALPCGSDWQTDASGVFVCGDAHRGASLIVWAIAEGRSAAQAVDAYLMGESDLPAPVRPGALPLAVV